MKIQCQTCQAKYTIADDKVLGKVVKIRCKKCSATIVINGNEARPAEENADTHVFDYAAGSNEQWTVNVADGDQRTMTPAEIAAEYKVGVINDETYCWKDGMADWLPLRDIEQLYGLVKLGPRPSLADVEVPAPSAPGGGLFGSVAPAPSGESPFAGTPAPTPSSPPAGGPLFGGGAAASFGGAAAEPAPAAARRRGGHGQGADLFGKAATAGAEEDVMTSAAGAAAAGANDKLTGQRNENSVLFSLSALTDGAKAPENKTTATADGSGLIDIRALSASMGGDDQKKDKGSRVDDIMNLSGGGAFGAALAAPILAPPALETTDASATPAAGGSNKMLIGILGAGVLIAAAIFGGIVISSKSSTPAEGDKVASATTAQPTGAATANEPPPFAQVGSTAPADTGSDTSAAPPGTGNAAKAAAPAAKPAGGGVAAAAAKPAAEPAPAPAPAAAPAKPASFGDALAAAAGKPAGESKPSGGGGGASAPFDRGAAAGALGGVNVQSCKKPDGPTGTGHVKVTFAPDGSVSSAVIDGGPFPGTPVGGCIAGKFRGAHIPAFSGGPVSVGKSFTIN